MKKGEAAQILVNFINVRARHYGVRHVDKAFIEEMCAEALSSGIEGSLIRQAARTSPHWTTIRAQARRTTD